LFTLQPDQMHVRTGVQQWKHTLLADEARDRLVAEKSVKHRSLQTLNGPQTRVGYDAEEQ